MYLSQEGQYFKIYLYIQQTIFLLLKLVLNKEIRLIHPDEGLMLKLSASLYFTVII